MEYGFQQRNEHLRKLLADALKMAGRFNNQLGVEEESSFSFRMTSPEAIEMWNTLSPEDRYKNDTEHFEGLHDNWGNDQKTKCPNCVEEKWELES